MLANITSIEFDYSNYGPNGAHYRTNHITLWYDGTNFCYRRQYVNQNGELSNGIEAIMNTKNPQLIAKSIHWGCCGWSAGGHQIWQLTDKVKTFIDCVAVY